MIAGNIRDRLPRASLTLPGRVGDLTLEFVVDTGFDGDFPSLRTRPALTVQESRVAIGPPFGWRRLRS